MIQVHRILRQPGLLKDVGEGMCIHFIHRPHRVADADVTRIPGGVGNTHNATGAVISISIPFVEDGCDEHLMGATAPSRAREEERAQAEAQVDLLQKKRVWLQFEMLRDEGQRLKNPPSVYILYTLLLRTRVSVSWL